MARVLGNPLQAVTLAETLIAVGLLVVVVLLAVALGISSLRTNQKGSDLTVGSAWGTQVLENFVYSVPDSTASFLDHQQLYIPLSDRQYPVGQHRLPGQTLYYRHGNPGIRNETGHRERDLGVGHYRPDQGRDRSPVYRHLPFALCALELDLRLSSWSWPWPCCRRFR